MKVAFTSVALALATAALSVRADTCPNAPSPGLNDTGLLLHPAQNETLQADTPFLIQWCTGRYFKESTYSLSLLLQDDSNPGEFYFFSGDDGKDTEAIDGTHVLTNGTLPHMSYTDDKSYSLVVLEKHNNYYGSDGLTKTTYPLTITPSNTTN